MRTHSQPGRSGATVRNAIVKGIRCEVGRYRHSGRPERGTGSSNTSAWWWVYGPSRDTRCAPKSHYPVRARRASLLGVRRTSRVDPECP